MLTPITLVPITNTAGDFNPLFWVAAIDEPSNTIYLKVRLSVLSVIQRLIVQIVNAGNTTVPLTTQFNVAYKPVNGTSLVSVGFGDLPLLID